MDLTLRNLAAMARRWWWLLVLAPLVAGTVAFVQVSRQQDMYRASSTVEINPPSMGTDTYTYYDSSIVATYQQLITTSGVLDPVIDNLGLPLTESDLRAKITTEPITSTRLMRISVSDPNPQTAATLANEIAAQFQSFAQARTIEKASPYREALNQQIASTQAKIGTTQQLIDNLVANEDVTSPDIAAQIDTLRSSLTDLQNTYGQLILSANQMDLQEAGAQTGVVVVQDASAPGAPYAPNVRLYTLLAVLAGLCIGIGAVFLLEYLDNTTKVDTPYNELIGAPLMTTVPIVPSMARLPHQLFILDQPMSPESEAIRLLRANVEFAVASSEINTLAVTSAGPGEGKSTVTANLAVAMAQAGYSVVVVDADMRRPAQHEAFDLTNERGLSTLLARPDLDWKSVARTNADLKLRVITSGPIPPNPGDLLKSNRFETLLATISSECDMVVIDTPPAMAVSDALVVADVARDVLLVCRANETRVDRMQAAANALPETARVIGVALNYQKRAKGESYYYYYSNDDASSSNGNTPPSSNGAGRTFGQKVRELVPGSQTSQS
ncbi:MAG TPA: polysaccharide biosynthesis tyrosine autokinase [Thermomicrobiales bacterium]|nr:polysaccharide biosynthesis tyrosine autokinase [Thermomicrobiales bacterium]